jgi:hypothetical protein
MNKTQFISVKLTKIFVDALKDGKSHLEAGKDFESLDSVDIALDEFYEGARVRGRLEGLQIAIDEALKIELDKAS